jgi:hypothetical protein
MWDIRRHVWCEKYCGGVESGIFRVRCREGTMEGPGEERESIQKKGKRGHRGIEAPVNGTVERGKAWRGKGGKMGGEWERCSHLMWGRRCNTGSG